MLVVDVFGWMVSGIGLLLVALTLLLVVEIWLGALGRPKAQMGVEPPPQVAVVVPAHNEAGQLAPVLSAIWRQLRPTDRLLVVADNCTDSTADVALRAGAEVLQRQDATRRGKGYALDHAVQHLALKPPDVVVFMDADCFASPGALLHLAGLAHAQQRPQQAEYVMLPPPGDATPAMDVAAFSYRVKATLRPLGLLRLGLPCTLMGTGMALPWTTAAAANLASAEIVEDLLLTFDLARAGSAPMYCPDATVTSTFPAAAAGHAGQRRRWETGHINIILKHVPQSLAAALRTRNLSLLALALDTAVPPLALLALLVAMQVALAAVVLLLGGSPLALALGATASALLFGAVLIGWQATFPGKSIGPLLRKVPGYVLAKLGIYLGVFMKRPLEWVRTHRD